MPEQAPVPNVVSVAFRMQALGEIGQNTLYFQGDGTPWSAVDLEAVADAAVTSWSTNIAPVTASEVSLIEVIVTDLTSLDSGRIAQALDPFVSGGRAGGSDQALGRPAAAS